MGALLDVGDKGSRKGIWLITPIPADLCVAYRMRPWAGNESVWAELNTHSGRHKGLTKPECWET